MKSQFKIITDTSAISRLEWDSFILNNNHGNIFQSSEYYNSILSADLFKPLFIACINEFDNTIAGLLLGAIQQDYHGLIGYYTRRCTIVGGPVVQHENEETVTGELLNELGNHLKLKAHFIQFQFFEKPSTKICKIYYDHGYYYEDYMNIHIKTDICTEELWSQIKKSRKKGIRLASQQNLFFYLDKDIDSVNGFYRLLVHTYKKIRKPIPRKDYFYSLLRHIDPDKIILFNLTFQESLIMSCLCFRDKDRIYAYYVGVDNRKEILSLKPADFFYWKIILWCQEENIRIFDWMGAGKKNTPYGVRDFKLQFGGELFENGRMSKFQNKLYGITIRFCLKLYQGFKTR